MAGPPLRWIQGPLYPSDLAASNRARPNLGSAAGGEQYTAAGPPPDHECAALGRRKARGLIAIALLQTDSPKRSCLRPQVHSWRAESRGIA